jgi:hypothetical protein
MEHGNDGDLGVPVMNLVDEDIGQTRNDPFIGAAGPAAWPI